MKITYISIIILNFRKFSNILSFMNLKLHCTYNMYNIYLENSILSNILSHIGYRIYCIQYMYTVYFTHFIYYIV